MITISTGKPYTNAGKITTLTATQYIDYLDGNYVYVGGILTFGSDVYTQRLTRFTHRVY